VLKALQKGLARLKIIFGFVLISFNDFLCCFLFAKQRPYLLQGHARPITVLQFNYDGDLLFSASKDLVPSVWMIDCNTLTASGNPTVFRFGTYEGHKGTVWDVDCDRFSRRLLTASADSTCKLWRVDTGECLCTYKHFGSVRGVAWSLGNSTQFATISEPFVDHNARIRVYNVLKMTTPWDMTTDASTDPALNANSYEAYDEKHQIEPVLDIEIPKGPSNKRILPMNIYWTHNNAYLTVSFDNGMIRRYDAVTGAIVLEKQVHDKKINRLRYNRYQTFCITSSVDCTARLLDAETFSVIKTYKTDRPVNDAVLNESLHHVLLGGGQEAMSVTTTAGKVGKFETRFFHTVYETEFGTVKGHFGPINALDIATGSAGSAGSDSGSSVGPRYYASGAEDGYVRLHFFDSSYLTMKDSVPEDDEPLSGGEEDENDENKAEN
jgi:translation initiation factor 3 subunit I